MQPGNHNLRISCSIGLMGYLDGSNPCPPANVENTSTKRMVPDPNYLTWLRQDRLILHAIQVSCIGVAQSIRPHSKIYAEAWDKLKTTYANRSNTRKLALLDRLTNVKLEGKTITEYMQEIKNYH